MVEMILWHWFPIFDDMLDSMINIINLEGEVSEKTTTNNFDEKDPKMSTSKNEVIRKGKNK